MYSELEARTKEIAKANNAVRRTEVVKQADSRATTVLSRSALSQQQRHSHLDWIYDNIHVQLGKYILIAGALLRDGRANKDWEAIDEALAQLAYAERFIQASVAALEDASGCKQLQTEVYQQHLWQLRGQIGEAPADLNTTSKLHIVDEDRSKAVRKAIEKRKGVHPETELGVSAKSGEGSSSAKRQRGGSTGGRGRSSFQQYHNQHRPFQDYDPNYGGSGLSGGRGGHGASGSSGRGGGHSGGGHPGGPNGGRGQGWYS
ncbi:hypothetical protein CHLRE_17g716950v5 [Chlamydomonas reinhardtii]|uniref:Uncharacterized protein n=1 Tax=Chlamydomonas reinhardtii TaxID=3055 RepID=A8JD81_CHLRE|nr:uncharacterized protein CHLRE_17g716950v5 [Chlamydomonas reinhardtii]PNW70370.1 hypothetical protein CHLRE_17g716950v5 [Chlamydomonas reinhardtii]|eukprot:XP_001700381.1 predicted protein [Chlamydomonas reinhardtii]